MVAMFKKKKSNSLRKVDFSSYKMSIKVTKCENIISVKQKQRQPRVHCVSEEAVV